jgi:hypothetical protein
MSWHLDLPAYLVRHHLVAHLFECWMLFTSECLRHYTAAFPTGPQTQFYWRKSKAWYQS